LTNVFRANARVALVASRARVAPSTATSFSLASRQSVPSFCARSLSTSQVIRSDYDAPRRQNPPNDTLYLGNLPYSVAEDELRELLSGYGDIKAVRVAFRADGTPKGFAHVEFADRSSAVRAIEAHTEQPFYITGRDVKVDYASSVANLVMEPYHKLYVHEFERDEEHLREMFAKFDANIVRVYLLKNASGAYMGNGFIEFQTVDQATRALNELNGHTEDGVKLNLAYARPPRKSGPGRAYGDSNDYRGGGGV